MMKGKLGTIAVALLALITVSAGGAVALTMTDVTASDMPVEENLTVDSDTESLSVTAVNLTDDTADVTVYGVNGSETQEATATLNTSSTDSDTYEFTAVDAGNYSEYRVVVNSTGGADEISIEEVGSSVDGAGGISTDTILTIGGVSLTGGHLGAVLLVLLSGLGIWFVRE